MKIIVTGASGFVGRALVSYLCKEKLAVYPIFRNHVITHANARYCDLRDYDSVKKIISDIDPSVIVHCAATSSIELCEKESFDSWENNVLSTFILARSLTNSVHFLFLSTSEVFDGTSGGYKEDSLRNPVHWYGHTKSASEDIVRKIIPTHTILRLSYQYGYDREGKNFIHCATQKLEQDKPVSASDDLVSTPTYIGTTVSAIYEIILNRITGIYNIADKDSMSKYELIFNLAQIMNKTSLVNREKSSSVFVAKRPANTSLDVTKFSNNFSFSKPLKLDNALAKFYSDFKQGISILH